MTAREHTQALGACVENCPHLDHTTKEATDE
jgi:hypothetical protein